MNAIEYTSKKTQKANEFLNNYLMEKFHVEEKNIITMVIDYKTQFEKLDICYLPHVGDALYQSEFVKAFKDALKNNQACIYDGSWDHQMGYWATGHDIRFSYALYHDDKIWIRSQLGETRFRKLMEVIDENGTKLMNSNHQHRNYQD